MINHPAATDAPARPTAVLRSPWFQGHETGGHPENPRRLAAVEAELDRHDLLAGRPAVRFGPATDEQLARVHAPAYLARLAALGAAAPTGLDPDTLLLSDSLAVARLATGAAVAAVDAALDGVAARSFALVRPPGHHATPTRGMGFCLLNSVAVAAAHAIARGLTRVAVVDWDVHHGNGTQDAFYAEDRVLVCSVHQSPLYPGTGAAGERGVGRGEGATLNVPLRPGRGDADYARVFDEIVLPAVCAFRPELVLVSAGFDAHAADPLGGMRLTEDGFVTLARRVAAVADEHAGGRLVAVLEGGYDPTALARSVAAVLGALDGVGDSAAEP